MFPTTAFKRRLFSALAVSSCLLTSFPVLTKAQGLPGLVLFSGINRESQLNYVLDYGRRDMWDRYELKIPAKKLKLGVAQFEIEYPEYYDGKLDKDKIEVLVKGKSVPLQTVNWDKEGHRIQIFPQEPIQAGNDVKVIFNNVKNPPFGGTYYFHCHIFTPGDVPLPRYVGTWILSIG
jgi:hypothetical protein